MHAISITLAPGHAQAVLHFKTAATAEAQMAAYHQALATAGCLRVTLRDDFTRALQVALKDIIAVCVSDVEASNESSEVVGLLQQQASARLNKKWIADPLFRSLQSMAALAGAGASAGGRPQ